MKKKLALALVFVMGLSFTACGKTKQEVPKESLAKTQQQPVTNAISTEEFKDINVTIDVDWNVKKEKQTKYIVTIQNKSNRNFSGTVKIVPTTSRTMGSFDVNIDQLM